jgi:hypothetical protein
MSQCLIGGFGHYLSGNCPSSKGIARVPRAVPGVAPGTALLNGGAHSPQTLLDTPSYPVIRRANASAIELFDAFDIFHESAENLHLRRAPQAHYMFYFNDLQNFSMRSSPFSIFAMLVA